MVGILVLAFVVALIIWFFSQRGIHGSTQVTRATWAIPDKYQTIHQLQEGLREAGLESSNLIVGIDFTKSNEWTGQRTFGGKPLHTINPAILNPYQTVISVLGKTLEPFDEDKQIPAFGFGDSTTTDKYVFPFLPDRPCNGFQEVLSRYNELTPHLQLAGPTSFAPIIKEAISLVKRTGSYHILVIVADGQVTNEKDTINAIVEASRYPLSIILVGVGDGPWEKMNEFDDGLPQRKFDNFQFVNFDDIMRKHDGDEVKFALAALMEIPDQYKEIRRLNLLSKLRQ